MKKQMIWTAVAAATFAAFSMGVNAQNIAIVNGKAVPSSRVEALKQQVARSGRPINPEVEAQIKEEVIAREVFMQEAQKRGLDASEEYKSQIELARQTILIRELFAEFQKTAAVTDADVQAEYDKFVAANGGKEYRARHILVETQAQADAALQADLARFARGVWTAISEKETTQNRFDALVSFAFNVGLGNLLSSTLLRKHIAGDYVGAADQFIRWNRAAGKVLAGLTRRREAEAKLYRGQA